MAPARKRSTNLARRRRLSDEDEAQSVTERAADSGSDVSSDADDGDVEGEGDVDADADADVDADSESDVDSGVATTEATKRKRGAKKKPTTTAVNRGRVPSPPIARSDVVAEAMEGLSLDESGAAATTATTTTTTTTTRPETLGDRRRREHDEYKKKRDSDPAFIPNRGAFFMHDSRSHPGPNAFRPAGGRGRGGGGGRGVGPGGPFAPAQRAQGGEATDAPWQHDLHDAVNAPQQQQQQQQHPVQPSQPQQQLLQQQLQQHPRPPFKPAPPPRNFSTTRHTHNAVVRVLLPAMKAPVLFHNVPIKSHTRLPNHRPPLRRDKPVRISLPPAAPRYIFPTVDRSFIFIPRALRPNQQGFGRGRARFGSMGGGGGGGGGFSSRRTSAYGGSVYSPSVALSRRSSIARDNMVSPAGSLMSRNGSFIDPARPVVRLPRMPTGPAIISPTNGTYPPPQKPTFRENWQGQLPMHQPRPTKNVNVAGIESPSLHFNPPQQQEQQPFHQQVPAHIQPDPFYPHHARQPSYPAASTGTPLNNIPERAIHAAPFQPYPAYPAYPYFYPPAQPYPMNMNMSMPMNMNMNMNMLPVFVPGAQQYTHPAAAPAAPASAPAPAPAPSTGLVAVEQNGMTFYMDAAQVPPPQPQSQPYPGAVAAGAAGVGAEFPQNTPGYSMQGMGGMMTPAPDGFFYPGAGFYAQ